MVASFKLRLFCLFCLLSLSNISYGQLPSCGSNSLIYYITGGLIYNWNPALPFSATNPVLNSLPAPPAGANALSFCENINDPTAPSPTFYTVVSGNYYYYNGNTSTWVNTGHAASTVNIGGGGGFIYGMVGGTSPGGIGINKYNGTANASFLVDVPNYTPGGPADLQASSPDGDFYVLKIAAPAWLRKYNSSGTLVQEWSITGGPGTGAGGGFAIVNNTVYSLCLGAGLWSGPIGPTSITLTEITGVPATLTAALDFAACAGSLAPPNTNDTLYMCSNTGTINASGTASYSYNVLSGNATLTGTGPAYTVTASTMSKVLLHSTANSGTNNITDTFLIVPAPVVNAGPDDTLSGCGTFTGQLNGTITNTASWVTYNTNWTPAATITSGANTLTPTVQPTATGYYVMTVTTGAENGNCNLSDSVKVTTVDRSVNADFSFDVRLGCTADTVIFTNNSQDATHFIWNFGDGSLTDTTTSPTHVYTVQNAYTVALTASNETCTENIFKPIDIQHPLQAMFNTDKDSLCQGGMVVFTDASTVSTQTAQYHWDFGDGGSSDLMNPSHAFDTAGTFQVALVVADAIPCYDTAYYSIRVDPTPELHVSQDKHSICIGELVNYNAVYSQEGIKGITWDFGDGTVFSNTDAVKHAYGQEGTFWVNLTADYNTCPSLNLMDSVTVHPFPKVDLGPDTSICLHGNPILLSNQAENTGSIRFRWNNGDTTATFAVQHEGIYKLTVQNAFDCSTTDEIEVKKDCYTDVPNSFTPNGDGINDYFFPRQLLSQGVVGFTMQVFNRWGQVIFETGNPNGRGWDGKFNEKDQPQGVYIYQIQVSLKNGKSENYKGNVTLIR